MPFVISLVLLVILLGVWLIKRRRRPEGGRFAHWPPSHSIDLYVCLQAGTLNSIGLGDHLQRAQVFGQPRASHPDDDPQYLSLLFTDSGLILEFEHELLVYIGILIAPGAEESENGTVQWAAPELALPNHESVKVNDQTTFEQIQTLLGLPENMEADSDEYILAYTFKNRTMEFEFNANQKLRRWNIFPSEIPNA